MGKESKNNQIKLVTKRRGGVRKGAGRKKGSLSKKTREIAEKAAATGITPLEVMIEAMRKAYKSKGGAAAAFQYAIAAAPYMHPRISSIEVSGPDAGPIEHEHNHKMTNMPPDTDSIEEWLESKAKIDEAYAKSLGTTDRTADGGGRLPG